MSLFGRIFGRVFGGGRKSNIGDVQADSGAAPGRWYPVQSSNVSAVRWTSGRAAYDGKPTQLRRAADFLSVTPSAEFPKRTGILQYSIVKANKDAGLIGGKANTPYTLGTLTVRFKSGWMYEYYDVQKMVLDEMLSAGSKGRFVWTDLRNRYRYRRVG